MTNLERLEKTRQLEKLKSDSHFYKDVTPFLNFLEVACGELIGLLVVGGVLGFEITVGNIIFTAAVMTGLFLAFQKSNKKKASKDNFSN